MELLQLNIHRRFFCEILAETKKIEYRDRTDYWHNRLMKKDFTHIRFRNGYQSVAPEMTIELRKIKTTNKCYELHLGKILHKKHTNLLK